MQRLALLIVMANTCLASAQVSVIPKPAVSEARPGTFSLDAETRIYFPEKGDWQLAAQALQELVARPLGKTPTAQPLLRRGPGDFDRPNSIFFNEDTAAVKAQEGYRLDVSPKRVLISARTAMGAFYAVQTLRQLLPQKMERPNATEKALLAPCCLIEDSPRFPWRGMHLDVCRHFFGVDFIKKYIDLMAMHKMNTFHWHLTDDQGWRIEVKKFPKLQEISSRRKQTLVGHYSDSPQKFDGTEYGGFYTQEEVKEVVEYARKRFVTVLPEIEMPGHAMAVLAAYPKLGCTGKPVDVAGTWGVFDDVFCAGNDDVFEFIDKVFEEILPLFPGKYVHVGGDECPKVRWHDCEKCQKRMKKEKLADEHELQSYFIRRVEKLLEKRGKSLIGWDEILEGGIAPTATIMSWRGTEGGIAAAKQGHDAVMCPGSHCYLDHYQGSPEMEPLAIGGLTTIQKTYSYEPVPPGLSEAEARHILGAQGNIWTEYIGNEAAVEYMAYPRAVALAEVVWSKPEGRDFSEFAERLKYHFGRLDALGINYSRAMFEIAARVDSGLVSLSTIDKKAEIRYELSGKEPSMNSPLYSGPLSILKKTSLKAASFLEGKKIGRTLNLNFSVNLATGRQYRLSAKPEKYTGGNPFSLTDGLSATMRNWDRWVGLGGGDLDPTFDFGEAGQKVKLVRLHFLSSKPAWIHPPRKVEVQVSDDGQSWRPVGFEEVDAMSYEEPSVNEVEVEFPSQRARFWRVLVQNFGKIDAKHPGAGEPAWLFVDEIIME